jgi:hypothetical protein
MPSVCIPSRAVFIDDCRSVATQLGPPQYECRPAGIESEQLGN